MSFFGSGSGMTGFTGFGAANQQQQQPQPQQQQQPALFGTPANATQGTGFSFGQATPAAGGMFGAAQPQQQQQVQTANTGFAFGSPANNPPATAGIPTGSTRIPFGTQITKPTDSSGTGFAFGTPPASASTGFGSGFGAPNVTASPLGAQFGSIGSTASTGFTFGSTTPSAGVGFGATTPNAATSTPFGVGFGLKSPTSMTGLVTSTAGSLSFGQPAAISATPAATPSFGFTGLQTSTPSFGASTAAVTTTPLGFGIAPATSTPAANVASIAPTVAAAPASTFISPGFNMVGTGQAATTFNLGGGGSVPQNKAFTFGAATTASPTIPLAITQPSPGFQLGSAFSAQPLTATSSLATVAAAPATTNLPSFVLGKPATAATANTNTTGTTLSSGILGLAQTTTTTPATAGLGFNMSLPAVSTTAASTVGSTAQTGFGLTSTTIGTTPSTTGFTFGTPVSKPTTGLLLTSGGGVATTTTTATLAGPQTTLLTTSAAQTSTALATIPAPPLTVATIAPGGGTVSVSTAAPAASLISFKKFEEDINKWTLELEEQERVFLSQATQVNAWDRVLISNGDKITQLNDALERIKLDQEHLDQEIDFIRSQQTELEELLVPLEKSVESMPTISIHQHADLEREQTFQMAENIDSQLRLMSRDLKEIIEHLNSSTGNQDVCDPIQQIGKILNSHMDSLQWIDQNTGVLRNKIDEVARVYESCRQNQHDSGMRLPYSL